MTPPPTPDDSANEADQSRRRSSTGILIALLVLLGAIRVLFPGDIAFINDEPTLISNALDANEGGTAVSSGLMGTRGATYGPVPTWYYQLSLSVTSDLRWVATARIIFITALSALALVLLSRNLAGLVPVLGAFAFLSPYLWFYSRDLWDNSFAIPFSAMLLGAYVQFCSDGRLRSLAGAGLFGTLCFMTHFMTMPLVVAIGIHFVATQWRTALRSPRFAVGVLVILAFLLMLSFPYLSGVSGGPLASFRLLPSLRSIAFSLNGMRLFSLLGFEYVIGSWGIGGLGLIAQFISLFSYGVGAYGVVLCIREVRGGEDVLQKQVASVLLLALACFVLVANGKLLREHPHYYNGVWIVFFCFWWMGMSRLIRQAWARRVFLGQVAVMACFLVGVASWIHLNRGTQTLHYGPTLANQMAVARELDRLGIDDAPPSTARHPRAFPHAIRVLRRLNRRSGGIVGTPGTGPPTVEIAYVDPDGPSGEIVLLVTPSAGRDPDG